VKLNGGGPFAFVLDTGAGGMWGVDQSVADSLGLRSTFIAKAGGAGEEAVDFNRVDSAAVSIDGLYFGPSAAIGLPLHRMDPHWGKRKDGLVGSDLLSALVTRIDYEKGIVTFHEAAAYEYRGPGARVPVQIAGGFILVEAQVLLYGKDAPIDALFMIDTGVRQTVFNSPYSRVHGLPEQSPKTVTGVTGFGIGGVSRGVIGRVRGIRIGPCLIENPVVSFSTDTAGALADTSFSGIIGADVLERFAVVLDYSRSSIFLDNNKSFGRPFEFDMSGIRFVMRGERFEAPEVSFVFDGSPAAEAGVKVGDVVTAIDGRSPASFTMETLRTYMQREGAAVRLDLKGGAGTKSLELRLRKLV